jgi:hypothetical protein
MTTAAPPRVQLLSVPGCPLVERARAALRSGLATARVIAAVEEFIGAYPSPTILIDGHDVVVGAPPASGRTYCRLDLPTTAHVVAALKRRS